LKTFKELDQNNDGQLSREELLKGYTKLNGEDDAKQEVERIFKTIDVNDTNAIDFSEFLLATVDYKKLLSETKLTQVFQMIDADHSGGISRQEIKNFFSMTSNSDDGFVTEMIEEVDSDNDGEIS